MERLCGPLGFTYKSEEAGQRARAALRRYGAMTATSVALRTSSAVQRREQGVATAVGRCAGNFAVERRAVRSAATFFIAASYDPYLQNARRSFGLSDAGAWRGVRSRRSARWFRPSGRHADDRRSGRRFAMRRGQPRVCKRRMAPLAAWLVAGTHSDFAGR